MAAAAAAVCFSGPVAGFSSSSCTTTSIKTSFTRNIRSSLTASHRIRQPRSQLYNANNDSTEGEASSDNSNTSSEPVSLFEDHSGDSIGTSTNAAKFGESVPLRKPTASFGESVPLKRPASSASSSESHLTTDNNNFMEAAASAVNAPPETGAELAAMRKRNLIAAVASISLALLSYLWQFTHPVTPVQLLADMQASSAPLTLIGNNGKPTVVDFWAPWCENCKMAAPTLQRVEQDYKDKVNFVLINGDQAAAWPLIERFGVDAIPHMALINAEGDVETALIGPIPKRVLEADLNVLLANAALNSPTETGDPAVAATEAVASPAQKQDLPYKMLDVFANQPQLRRIQFISKED